LLKRPSFDDSYRSMALDLAAERGDEVLVEQLLRPGVKIARALHLAAQNGHLNVVSRLLAAGATVAAHSYNNSTPLHLATQSGYVHVVVELLKVGSEPSETDADGS